MRPGSLQLPSIGRIESASRVHQPHFLKFRLNGTLLRAESPNRTFSNAAASAPIDTWPPPRGPQKRIIRPTELVSISRRAFLASCAADDVPAVLQFLRSPGHRPFDAEVALGLIYAAEKDATKVVDTLLVEFWIDVNAKDDRGRTALLAAAEAGALSTLKSLLASDRIDVKAVDSLKRTALMLASLGGHALAVQHLLADPRTNPRSRDSNLHTAFLHAAISGHLPTLEILLADPRVDPEVRNAKGESALDLASEPARTFLRSAVAAKKAALTRALKLAEVKARLPPAPPLVADSKGRRKELVDIDREPPKQARPGSTDRNSKFK